MRSITENYIIYLFTFGKLYEYLRFEMENAKVCSCFGHRNGCQSAGEKLDKLDKLVEESYFDGYTVFMSGGMGKFDEKFESAVRKAKLRHKKIKLFLVVPYFSNKLNTNKDYLEEMYDGVIVPDTVEGVFFKNAINVRNRWIVDNSDLIIAYVERDYGGAFEAVKYAKSKGKQIINIGKLVLT